MKYSIVALALAAVSTAQSLPSCAVTCIEDSIKAKAPQCSSATDYACVCKNISAIQGDATGCVLAACGADVALNEVLPAVKALCANPPTGGSSTPAPTTPAPTSEGPTDTATDYPVPPTSTDYPVPPTSTDAPTTPAPTSDYPVPTAPTTIGTVTTPTGNGTAPAPTGTSPPVNGAAGVLPGLAMLAVAALAL